MGAGCPKKVGSSGGRAGYFFIFVGWNGAAIQRNT